MTTHRVAVKTMIVDEDKVLIVKRPPTEAHSAGVWEIPGGRVELGEEPHEGLHREVEEETGIDIEIICPLTIRQFSRKDGQEITMITFLSKAKTRKVRLSEEHTNYEWIKIEKVKEKLNEHFHKDIDAFHKFELHKFI